MPLWCPGSQSMVDLALAHQPAGWTVQEIQSCTWKASSLNTIMMNMWTPTICVAMLRSCITLVYLYVKIKIIFKHLIWTAIDRWFIKAGLRTGGYCHPAIEWWRRKQACMSLWAMCHRQLEDSTYTLLCACRVFVWAITLFWNIPFPADFYYSGTVNLSPALVTPLFSKYLVLCRRNSFCSSWGVKEVQASLLKPNCKFMPNCYIEALLPMSLWTLHFRTASIKLEKVKAPPPSTQIEDIWLRADQTCPLKSVAHFLATCWSERPWFIVDLWALKPACPSAMMFSCFSHVINLPKRWAPYSLPIMYWNIIRSRYSTMIKNGGCGEHRYLQRDFPDRLYC